MFHTYKNANTNILAVIFMDCVNMTHDEAQEGTIYVGEETEGNVYI